MQQSFWSRPRTEVWRLILPGLLAAAAPAAAGVSANLCWTASSDSSVAGYNLYYGSQPHQYTNQVPVDAVTNAVISGLEENTTYYFAAKARNRAGDESDFSNETAFAGVTATPNGALILRTLRASLTGNPLVFGLGAGAPAGAVINATNGLIRWTPGRAAAGTTNYFSVIVTDTVDASLSTSETLAVIISDYLDLQLGTAAVTAGQPGSLPLTVAASSTITNLQITLDWPDDLASPALSFAAPVIAGSLSSQNHQLLIQLQTSPAAPLSGTNIAAIVNFQTLASQSSAFLGVTAAAVSGNTATGGSYANVLAESGEVVVVGSQPLLRSQAGSVQARTLSLYANPGTYNLQYATSLAEPVNWTTLTTYQQTNVAQAVSLDATIPVIFYRLQQP